jgi:hypothetical protein
MNKKSKLFPYYNGDEKNTSEDLSICFLEKMSQFKTQNSRKESTNRNKKDRNTYSRFI